MNLQKVVDLLKPDVGHETKLTGISLFFGKWLESLNRRVVEVEARQWQKGDKGDTGPQGPKGLNGKDGIDGKDGINGRDGKNGKDGKNGEDGVSIVDVDVAKTLKEWNGTTWQTKPLKYWNGSSWIQ